MAIATVTTKGQVTIPKEVRDALHMHAGDKMEIYVTDSGEALMRPLRKTVDDVFCILKNDQQQPVSIAAMNQAMKDRLKRRYS